MLNENPTPEINDIKAVIKPVLRHRIIPNFNAEAEGIKRDDILDELLSIWYLLIQKSIFPLIS